MWNLYNKGSVNDLRENSKAVTDYPIDPFHEDDNEKIENMSLPEIYYNDSSSGEKTKTSFIRKNFVCALFIIVLLFLLFLFLFLKKRKKEKKKSRQKRRKA